MVLQEEMDYQKLANGLQISKDYAKNKACAGDECHMSWKQKACGGPNADYQTL